MLSIGGFAVRGCWMLSGNVLLERRLTKTLPHIVDTVLLASAIGMLVTLQLNPFSVSWLAAKICALLVYIGLGMIAFRFGRTQKVRGAAFLLALVTAGYILLVAYTKSPLG